MRPYTTLSLSLKAPATISQKCIHYRAVTKHLASTVAYSGAGKEGGVGLFGLLEDRNSSFLRGAAKAPQLIRAAYRSPAFNTFSELSIDLEDYLVDAGDLTPSQSDHRTVHETVAPTVAKIFKEGLYPLCLGGDHSISFPVVKAVREVVGMPLTLVHFDAHPDIYHSFQGSESSHASQFARICETPGLIRQLISVGLRTTTAEQRRQLDRFGVGVVEARDIPSSGRELGKVLRDMISDSSAPLYISFDLDVIEPGLAPGVSHREAGGLTPRQAIDALHSIAAGTRIVAADFVEFNPEQDICGLTASVCGKLMKEIAAAIVISNKGKPRI